MLTTKKPNTYELQVKAFENLLKSEAGPEKIKKQLVELHINYSRQLIEHYDSGQTGIVPLGNPQNQLYCLMQLIALCDVGNQEPLLTELVEGNLGAA
ncbi:MAG: hypothetical protein ACO1OF_14005 [Adhaeribacter sp.]